MKKAKIFIVALLLILTVGCVSAADDNATSDSSTGGEVLNLEYDDEGLQTSFESDIVGESNVTGTFKDLNDIISKSKINDVIQLDKDYAYNNATDYSLIDGIDIDKRITIDGQGHKIDGADLSRIFRVNANSVTLNNINFVNAKSNSAENGGGAISWAVGIFNRGVVSDCSFVNCSSLKEGGAIYAGEISIYNSRFVNCRCVDEEFNGGGALSLYGGTVSNCSFLDCYSNTDGGAVRIVDNYEISDCSFINCSATQGGALSLYFKGTVFGCSFLNCSVPGGNGAICLSGTPDPVYIFDCSFVNCIAEDNGGAIGVSCNNGAIVDCTFEGCSANNGGAIFVGGDNLTISNTIFKSNIAYDLGGGAIYSWRDLTIDNSTFTDNNADRCDGGALYLNVKSTIKNSTFKGNDAYNGKDIWTGSNESLVSSNTFIVAVGDNREDIIYGIPLKSVRSGNYIYYGGRLVEEPSVDISYSDIVLGEDENVKVSLPGDATGKIEVNLYKDGKSIKTSSHNLSGVVFEVFSNLGIGVYNITVAYSGDVNYFDTVKSVIFMVRPSVNISQNVTVGDNADISFDLVNATGSVKIYVDGEEYVIQPISNNKLEYNFNTNNLSYGSHNVTFEYIGDSMDKNVFSYWDNQTNTYVPYVYNIDLDPVIIKTNEVIADRPKSDNAGVVVVELPEDATGTISVFVSGSKSMVVDIVKGMAKIDLSSFKDGNYDIRYEYSGDSKYLGFSKDSVTSLKNDVPSKIVAKNANVVYTNKYSVTVKTKTDKVVSGVVVTFFINGKKIGTAKTTSKGVASIKISKLPGPYTITAKIQNITAVKKLTVKNIVTLKSATVKKSAKKLTLQANLGKVDGKYLKNKKVTFKFNGKTYAAKTDAKGVAKVTVKSSVLKKLKVGKKVTYQATYLKNTVKKTVKVKK